MSLTDEIRQIAINLADRLHKLEVQESPPPLSFEYTSEDGLTFGTTSAPILGAEAILEPGLYLVTGHFDVESVATGDEGFVVNGQLTVNAQAMPGAAAIKLLSALGSDGVTRRGLRGEMSMSWVLSLWDYKQAVLLDGPKLFYRLDDVSVQVNTTWARDLPRGNPPGIYTGGARRQPGPLKIGLDRVPSYAVQFDGIDDHITSNLTGLSTASGSLEIWFKTSAGVVQALIGNNNLTTHRDGVALYLNAAGRPVMEVASAAAVTTLTGTTPLNDNAWHHVVGTFDGTTLRLYVDGIFDASVAQGGVVPTAVNIIRIGTDGVAGGSFFNGYVAEPAYYSAVVLRPNRALLHYQIGKATEEYLPTTYYKAAVLADTPLRYYRLDEVAGSPMYDSSPSNRTGTYERVTLNQPGGILVDPDGTYNASAKFDSHYGTPSIASVTDTGLPLTNADRTLEAWIYLTVAPGAGVNAVVAGYGMPGIADQAWYLSVINTMLLRFSTDGGNIDGTTVLQTFRWYHVAVKNIGNNYTIYLDGDVEATGTLTTNTVQSGWFRIGNLNVANRTFIGLIDEVSLTASALTNARIAERYRIGRSNRAFIRLAAYKTGGTGGSGTNRDHTKLIVTKLQPLSKS